MAIKILNDLLPIAEQTEVGVVKPDNVSITITETGELQSSVVDLPEDVVTAENYDNPKLWKGTLEEYNAIETKNPLVTYIITDDNVETLKTTDYNALSNKPSINDVTLEGNKTLEELNIQAADTSLTTSQITNCITKIPQDIKLELTDGTLTLKAGSKVYVPNGKNADDSLKFDEVVVASDKNLTNAFIGTYNDNAIVYVKSSDTIQADVMSTRFCSGATDEFSSLSGTHYWYDTTNNIIKKMAGTEQIDEVSFPICLMRNIGNEGFTSINQVFNRFGYIGSTIFALPGIEGLIPNGRNTDGSLNNTKFTMSSMLTRNITNTNAKLYLFLNANTIGTLGTAYNYDEYNNLNLNGSSPYYACNIGTFSTNSTGRITSFTPNTTFQAIDRNDTEWASTTSKPSNRYIDLTLGANGSTYTAPANGWIQLIKTPTGANQYLVANSLDLPNTGIDTNNIAFKWSNGNTYNDGIFFPVRKGQQFTIGYTFGGATVSFKFIYDEGVK